MIKNILSNLGRKYTQVMRMQALLLLISFYWQLYSLSEKLRSEPPLGIWCELESPQPLSMVASDLPNRTIVVHFTSLDEPTDTWKVIISFESSSYKFLLFCAIFVLCTVSSNIRFTISRLIVSTVGYFKPFICFN